MRLKRLAEVDRLKTELPALLAKEETAKNRWESSLKEDKGACWEKFRLENPREYADLMMMFDVQVFIEKTAAWLVDDVTYMGSLEALVNHLKTLIDSIETPAQLNNDALKEMDDCVDKMLKLLKSPDDSQMGFLKNLPEIELKLALHPVCKRTLTHCKEVVSGFEKTGASDPAQLVD